MIAAFTGFLVVVLLPLVVYIVFVGVLRAFRG